MIRHLLVLTIAAWMVQSGPALAQRYQIRDAVDNEANLAETRTDATLVSRTGLVQAADFPALRAESAESEPMTSQGLGSIVSGDFTGTAITMGTSLIVVLGIFAGFVLVMRKLGGVGNHGGQLPDTVMQRLGSSSIDPRTEVTFLRCGSKVLIVAQSAGTITPLGEVTDPDEVRSLTAACLGKSAKEFMQTIKEIETTRPRPGFAGEPATQPVAAQQQTARSRGRLFATA